MQLCGVIGLVFAFFYVCSAEATGTEDIVLINDVRLAYYTPAPKGIARSMRTAIEKHCSETSDETGVSDSFCAVRDPLFIRAVDVLGHKLKTGFACSDEDKSGIKYYLEDMVGQYPECLYIYFDTHTKSHIVVERD